MAEPVRIRQFCAREALADVPHHGSNPDSRAPGGVTMTQRLPALAWVSSTIMGDRPKSGVVGPKRIQRRPVLGGLMTEYGRVA